MNNVKSQRVYKAYTAFTNVVTVKRHYITNDASCQLVKTTYTGVTAILYNGPAPRTPPPPTIKKSLCT